MRLFGLLLLDGQSLHEDVHRRTGCGCFRPRARHPRKVRHRACCFPGLSRKLPTSGNATLAATVSNPSPGRQQCVQR